MVCDSIYSSDLPTHHCNPGSNLTASCSKTPSQLHQLLRLSSPLAHLSRRWRCWQTCSQKKRGLFLSTMSHQAGLSGVDKRVCLCRQSAVDLHSHATYYRLWILFPCAADSGGNNSEIILTERQKASTAI